MKFFLDFFLSFFTCLWSLFYCCVETAPVVKRALKETVFNFFQNLLLFLVGSSKSFGVPAKSSRWMSLIALLLRVSWCSLGTPLKALVSIQRIMLWSRLHPHTQFIRWLIKSIFFYWVRFKYGHPVRKPWTGINSHILRNAYIWECQPF